MEVPVMVRQHLYIESALCNWVQIALRWMPLDLTDEYSTLVQVMAWCHLATSHYLSQCWPSSILPYMGSLGHNELSCCGHRTSCDIVDLGRHWSSVLLSGATKLSLEAILPNCQLDSLEHISLEVYSNFKHFHARKVIWKCFLQDGSHFVSASMCWLVSLKWPLGMFISDTDSASLCVLQSRSVMTRFVISGYRWISARKM